jgi:hypothetical protein
MSDWRFVVAEGDLDGVVDDADLIVIERRPEATLLEATAAGTARLQLASAPRVSVFHNAAIARTAFEHFTTN